MNVRSRMLALLLAAQMMVLSGAGTLAADDAIPCERRLPQNVAAYVSFRNIAELRTQWSQTLPGQLVQDEALADFRAAVEKQIDEVSQRLAEHIGLGVRELLEIPHGELAAAVAIQGDGKPAVVLLMDFGDKADAVHKLIGKLEEGAKDRGLDRSEEEFEETKMVVYRRAAQDENKAPEDAASYFIKDTFLAVGNSPAPLKSVLNRWDGKHESTLADNPVYRYVADNSRDEQQAPPALTWFVDPIGLVKAVLAANPKAAPQANVVLTMLPFVGADKFKGLGGSFDMAHGEFDMVSRTLIYFDPPARGVVNLFQFDADNRQVPPKWVTSDAASYFAINWNIARAYDAAESLVDSFQGAGAFSRLVQQLADHEQSGGVHLKKDLIDQLTGKVHVVGESSGDDEEEDDKYLVAVEVKNAAGARATLRKVAQIPGIQVKEREFQGEALYEIGADDAEDESLPMGFAVAEDQLFFATDVKLLERVLRGAEGRETLADSPSYKRIARRFPEKTASVSYSREDNSVQSLLAFLRSPGAIQMLGSDAAEWGEKLPSIDALKKYMTSSGAYMQPDERGLKITSFSLKKEAE